MEGVGKGTDEMLKDAAKGNLIDMGVISGSQTGVQSYYNAFTGQLSSCEAVGLDEQAKRWKAMADECQAIEKRIGKVAEEMILTAK